MKPKLKKIIMIGPSQPPTGGAAKNTDKIHALLSSKCEVNFYRNLPRSNINHNTSTRFLFLKLFVNIGILAKIILTQLSKNDNRFYIVTDAGLGMIFTLMFQLVIVCRKNKTYIHYRNYNYLYNKSKILKLIVSLNIQNTEHIVLSDGMKLDFQRLYGTHLNVFVSDNLALCDINSVKCTTPQKKLRIGFISNLNSEKGFDVFCTVMKKLSDSDMIEFHLAGKATDVAASRQLKDAEDLQKEKLIYHGEVHGDKKLQFYENIDMLVFPTVFKQEAQPNVLYEAAMAGCVILSTKHADIPRMSLGKFVHLIDSSLALEQKSQIFADIIKTYLDKDFSRIKKVMKDDMGRMQHASKQRLEALLEKISG